MGSWRRTVSMGAGVLLVLGAALGAGPAYAATYYVAVGGDDAGAGTLQDPFATFARAAQAMVPGDTTFVRGGTYNETVRPAGSGQPGLPLTWAAYAAETPLVTDVQYCIDLRDRDHVVIDGFTCDGLAIEPDSNVETGAAAWRGNYNEIRNSTFRNILESGVIIQPGHHNVIRDNTFESIGSSDLVGGEGVRLGPSATNNLIAGNFMSGAGHNLVQIIHTSHNIVRGNVFTNPWWKALGIFGDGVARRNVVDDNVFFDIDVPAGYTGENPPAIQLKGRQNLIRRNLFYDNIGPGLHTNASTNATQVDQNRIVHNVFYRNGGVAWAHDDIASETFVGTTDSNAFANNIAFENGVLPFPLPDPSLQVSFRLNGDPLNQNWVFHNLIQDDLAGEIVIKAVGISQAPLSWWQANYPGSFWGNIEGDPNFVDAAGADFALRANSPAVDAGTFLTVAASSGSGDTLVVGDASFFSDGYDLVEGDWIQLDGGGSAIVCRVDYFTQTLTLDRSLSWSLGQGVSLAYQGSAPDMGAVERQLGAPPTASCPSLPALPACNDRLDNDLDGLVDYPDDPQCASALDNTENVRRGCGLGGVDVVLVLAPLAWLRGRRRLRAERASA